MCDPLCRDPGAGTERAGSIGWAALCFEDQSLFPPEEAGVSSPPLPRRNQRLMIQAVRSGSRALEPLGPDEIPFFQRTKVLR